MAKYSFEFKKKVVLSYLNGEGGYKYLSKTYGVPAKRNIEQWVHNYQTLGDEGLLRSRKNDIYSFEKNFLLQNYIYQVKSHIKIWRCKKVLPIPV